MRFVAWLIELYGDANWPVFDWLEEELELRRARTAKLKQYAGAPTECSRAHTGFKDPFVARFERHSDTPARRAAR